MVSTQYEQAEAQTVKFQNVEQGSIFRVPKASSYMLKLRRCIVDGTVRNAAYLESGGLTSISDDEDVQLAELVTIKMKGQ